MVNIHQNRRLSKFPLHTSHKDFNHHKQMDFYLYNIQFYKRFMFRFFLDKHACYRMELVRLYLLDNRSSQDMRLLDTQFPCYNRNLLNMKQVQH
jgi:hypothetical protein